MALSTSGTYNFTLPNASVVLEAFDRIGIQPPQVSRHMLASARTSLNLEFIDWENSGFNFWKLTSGSLTLVAGTGTYLMPSNLVTVEEVYYSQVNALGTGVNSDRMLTPITRDQYAMITNKNQQGVPTQYWFQMLQTPQITLWEVPQSGQAAPNYTVSWYGLQQMQDANLGVGEVPDVARRGIDALCARMAVRLAEKFGPKDPNARTQMMMEKKTLAAEAWDKFARRDQEPGAMSYRPNIRAYARMGR